MTTLPVILALNAGSSSLKFVLFDARDHSEIVTGLAERIGRDGAAIRLHGADGNALPVADGPLGSHAQALDCALRSIRAAFPDAQAQAIGHRVVHGGVDYNTPVLVNDEVLAQIEALSMLAPLHQPHNIAGIRAAMAAFPGVPQIACFDTAFHRSHPWVNDTFALPRRFYDAGVRRYGFHGLSYEYIAAQLERVAPTIAAGRVVVAHLGNGASMCAIQNGRSVASTMGFTALDGLPMGTRCGQLDPGVVFYMVQQMGLSIDRIREILYEESGLLGLSGGLSNDMRTLEASADPMAHEAIEYFVFRIQRELGAMAAAMGGCDALVFCGGIGENSRLIRARVCERTEYMGLELDHARNNANEMIISRDVSRARIMVIPTNEAVMIARAAGRLARIDPETGRART